MGWAQARELVGRLAGDFDATRLTVADASTVLEHVGKRAFVPPEDPRHPRHQQATVSRAPPAA